jgi:hypothetical protein
MNDAIVFPTDDAGPRSLAELEARLARDFDFLALSPPAKDWLEPRAHPEWGPVLDYRHRRRRHGGAVRVPASFRAMVWIGGCSRRLGKTERPAWIGHLTRR